MSNFFDLGSDFGSDFSSELQTDFERIESKKQHKSKKRIPNEDKFRVLLTGKNQRISVNIADHLEKEKNYKTNRHLFLERKAGQERNKP